MKVFLKRFAVVLLVLFLPLFLFKVAQKVCWDNKPSWLAPPSLDSWAPTERIEAARQAAKTYGGKP